ncbi:MAG TPA: HEAT repeat domain-containing protein [bacterium]|nr:HEAT repeat domain-containing protein [bacterium]
MRRNAVIVGFLTFSLLLICVPSFVAAQSELEEDVAYLLWQSSNHGRIETDRDVLRNWLSWNIEGNVDDELDEHNSIREEVGDELLYLGPDAFLIIKQKFHMDDDLFSELYGDVMARLNGTPPEDEAADDEQAKRKEILSRFPISSKVFPAMFPLSDEELRLVADNINPYQDDDNDYSILFETYGPQLIPLLFEKNSQLLEAFIVYARPYLRQAMKDADPERRFRAATILVKAGDKSSDMTPIFLWALENLNWYYKEKAADCLRSLKRGGKQAIKIIQPWMNDDPFRQNNFALTLLAKAAPGEKATLAAIDEGLVSWNQSLFFAAIKAIGYQGKKAKRYLPQLMEIIQTNNTSAFWAALEAMQELGPLGREAIPVLMNLKGNFIPKGYESVSLEDRRNGGNLPYDWRIFSAINKIDPENEAWHKEYADICRTVLKRSVKGDLGFKSEIFFMPREYYLELADKLVAGDSLDDKLSAVNIYRSYSSEAGTAKLISLLIDCPKLDADHIVSALWERKDKIVPLIVPLLDHEQPRVRLAAVKVLNNLRNKPVDALIKASRDVDYRVRIMAWSGLFRMDSLDPKFSADVVRALRDPNKNVSAFVMSKVKFPFHKEAVPILTEALADEDEAVRAIAAWRLGYFGVHAKAAAPQVHALFDETDERVVKAAVDAFSRFGPSTLPLLREDLAASSDPDRQRLALEIIYRNAPFAGKEFPYVAQIVRHGTFNIRRLAMLCLLNITPMPTDSVPQVVELLQVDDLLIRLAAMAMLREVKSADKKLLSVFRRSLKDKCLEIRLLAATALLKNGKDIPQSRKLILATLTGGQKKDAGFVALALCSLGPDAEFAAPTLVELAKNIENVEYPLVAIGPAVVPYTLSLWKNGNAVDHEIALTVWSNLDEVDDRIVPLLLEALREDEEKRKQAVAILAKVDPETPGLIAALGNELDENKSNGGLTELLFKSGPDGLAELIDHNETYYFHAYEVEDIINEKYYKVLVDKMDTDDEKRLKTIFHYLKELREEVRPLLRDAFFHGTPKQRRAVIMFDEAGGYPFFGHVEQLHPLLNDPSFETRMTAVSMILLNDRDDPVAEQMMLSMLNSGDRQQIVPACEELARQGEPSKRLLEATLKLFIDNDDPEISVAALLALSKGHEYGRVDLRMENAQFCHALLAKIKNGVLEGPQAHLAFTQMQPTAFPVYLEALRSADKTQRDRLLPSAKAKYSLDEFYIPRLLELYREPNESVHLAVIRMLGSSSWEKVKTTLLPLFAQTNADIQASLIFAVQACKDELIWNEDIHRLFKDENSTVRLNAIRVFCALLAKETFLWNEEKVKLRRVLQPLTQDENADVRASAQEALAKLEQIRSGSKDRSPW